MVEPIPVMFLSSVLLQFHTKTSNALDYWCKHTPMLIEETLIMYTNKIWKSLHHKRVFSFLGYQVQKMQFSFPSGAIFDDMCIKVYVDVNTRTIEIPQCTRFIDINYCIKIYNTHFRLALPISRHQCRCYCLSNENQKDQVVPFME